MKDTTDRPRSEESASDAAQATNSQPSNATPTPRGRTFPTVISGRVSHSTKGRAKDAARSRGISLCEFVREAVQERLKTV